MTNQLPSKKKKILEPNDHIVRPWLAPNTFSSEECDRIIELSEELSVVEGTVGGGTKENINATIRNSTLKWFTLNEESSWIFQRLRSTLREANKLYKFNLRSFGAIQIAHYGVGGHYNTWHSDMGLGLNSLRKLSISVQLSKPEDYDGGKLEFQALGGEFQHSRERGTTIVFPPYLTHRVTPVTRGERWSLVVWVIGPPFC